MANSPSAPTPANRPPAGTTMPESSIGQVLQRGGEEFLLEKVDDMFAVNTTNRQSLVQMVQQMPGAQVTAVRSPAKLTEIRVNAGQRDALMQQARSATGVNYASHVYHLKNNPGSLVYVTNQLTVQFASGVTAAAIAQILQQYRLRQVKSVATLPNTFVVETTTATTENPIKLANRLMGQSTVLTAEPNVVIQTQTHYRPKDALYPKQWHLHHTGGPNLVSFSHVFAEKAWDVTRGSRAIVVAVMDDSVDISHPDFQGLGKIVAPRDFKENDFLPMPGEPEDNHGTACAGVAVAEENGVGAVGVAPGCALMPLRTTGFVDDESIEQLFNWAMTKGAAVISCSWGPSAVYFPLSLRQRAVLTQAATQGRNGKGCVIVFAAGNANRPTSGTLNERGWPNNALNGATQWLGGFVVHPDVITVSACTSLNKKSAYSNWGPDISVCAPSNNAPPGIGLPETGYIATPPEVTVPTPGLGIVTTDRRGRDGYDASDFTLDFGGTSSATPLVAGVAALVLSANPDLTAAEVRQILQQTADKIVDTDPDPQFGFRQGSYAANGHSPWFGYGKVNAFKAVQMATQRQMAAIAPSRQRQYSATVNRPIPDYNLQGLLSGIDIPESSAIRDIQVQVSIEHSYLGDLEVSLMAPNGQAVLLQGRSLGQRTSLQTTYTLRTTTTLRRFLGQPGQGRWQLRVTDHAQGDTGTLNNWLLILGF